MISAYKNITDVNSSQKIQIEKFLGYIKEGHWADAVEDVRKRLSKATTRQERTEIKGHLPNATISGTFKKRADNGLIKHSGWLAIDIDNLKIEDIPAVKRKLINDPYTYSCFTSVSGAGLCVILHIGDRPHEEAFDAAQHYYKRYGLAIDPSCRNVSRTRYVSHDPELYLNEKYKEFDYNKPETEERQAVSIIASTGNAEYDLESVIHFIEANHIDITSSYDNWLKIGFALAGEYGEQGRAYFHRVSQQYESYVELETDKKYDECLKSHKGSVSMGTFYYFCREAMVPVTAIKKESHPENFWIIRQETKNDATVETFEISRVKFLSFLEHHGFAKIFVGESPVFIRVRNNIAQKVQPVNIKDFVIDYIDVLPFPIPGSSNIHPFELKERFYKGINIYFSDLLLTSIKSYDFRQVRDTKEEAFYFFQNCFVSVTKDRINPVDSSELPGVIWDTQKLKRSYHYENCHDEDIKAEFNRFLLNVNANDINRYKSTISTIGFILHGYNDALRPSAVVLYDEVVSEDPEGGTGKGIIVKAVKQFKNTASIDGKNFRFDAPFPWQRVEIDTELISMEDISKRFDFERMFSILTEGLPVNKKNKMEFLIPFEEMPKWLFTSNYTLIGEGSSFQRRKIEIELSQYYTANFTPFDEFGHRLFDDWNDEEWTHFDNLMLHFVQFYLRNGVAKSEASQNAEYKKILQQAGEDFIDFLNNKDFSVPEGVNRTELYKEFAQGSKMGSKSFYNYGRMYLSLKCAKMNDHGKSESQVRTGGEKVRIVFEEVIKQGYRYWRFGEKPA